MIYICEDCGFLFRRFGAVIQCPQCESPHIRAATAKEAEPVLSLFDILPPNHSEEVKK